jgi:hypothetical protein
VAGTTQTWTTTIIDMGPALAIEIPDEVLEALGGKRVPVNVTLNGTTFTTTTAVMGGKLLIGINKANRTATGVAPGDELTVVVERDETPRVVEVPPELKAAFKTNEAAAATWKGLAYSHQREYAEWITGAKKAETRERRVAQAIEKLEAGAKSYR